MNDADAKARAVSEVLSWMIAESERYTAVISREYAPELVALVKELQRTSPSGDTFPDKGQRLWRRLEAALREYHDLFEEFASSEEKRKHLSGAKEERLFEARHRIYDSVEAFRQWIDEYYDLFRPEGASRKARSIHDLKGDAALLIAALVHHHKPDEEVAVKSPLTQKEFASSLGWTQSRVSRRMNSLFKGGMKAYKKMCRRGGVQGYLKTDSKGRREIDGIIYPEADE